jgi:hypothetical protein
MLMKIWKDSVLVGLSFQRLQLTYLKMFDPSRWLDEVNKGNEDFAQRLMDMGLDPKNDPEKRRR